MNAVLGFCLSALLVAFAAGPVAAQEHESKHRDNSGRQLAIVVPGIPNLKAPTVEVSPEMKQAIDKGAVVARNLSGVAVKRATDVVAWVNTMWRQLNEEAPTVTPARTYVSYPPSSSMRPLDAERGARKLYFTNEHRLKTVVGM